MAGGAALRSPETDLLGRPQITIEVYKNDLKTRECPVSGNEREEWPDWPGDSKGNE